MNLETVSQKLGTEVTIVEDENNNNNKEYRVKIVLSNGISNYFLICKSNFEREYNEFKMSERYNNETIEDMFIKDVERLTQEIEWKLKNNN